MERLPLLVSVVMLLMHLQMGRGAIDSTEKQGHPAQQQLQKGYLFSAILFGETPLGQRWAALRPDAERLFPTLKLKSVADLHVTIIYIGNTWEITGLDVLRKAMAVQLTDTLDVTPEIARFGRNNQVVAVALNGISEAFRAQVVAVKARLSAGGFKKPEPYDTTFRAHVTLAESRQNPPGEEENRTLQAFQEWISAQLQAASLPLRLDPSMPIRLMLAGASRPTPLPEYISVDDFLDCVRAMERR